MLQNKKLKVFIGSILLIICFFFIVNFFITNCHKVDFEKVKFNFVYLIVSYLLLALPVLLNGLIWKVSLAYIGEKLSFIQSLEIMSLTFLPRYIPGKVWGMIGQVWLTKKSSGIPEEKGTICVALTTVMSILSGLLFFLLILPFILKNEFSSKFYFLFIFIPLLLIILHPKIFVTAVNFV